MSKVTLSWQPVTTYEDGSPLDPGTVVKYNVYGAKKGQPMVYLTSVTTTTLVRDNVDSGIHAYEVSAVVGNTESALSTEVDVTVSDAPASPTGLNGTVS